MYFLINVPFVLAAAVPAVGVQQRCLRLTRAFLLDLKKHSAQGRQHAKNAMQAFFTLAMPMLLRSCLLVLHCEEDGDGVYRIAA